MKALMSKTNQQEQLRFPPGKQMPVSCFSSLIKVAFAKMTKQVKMCYYSIRFVSRSVLVDPF